MHDQQTQTDTSSRASSLPPLRTVGFLTIENRASTSIGNGLPPDHRLSNTSVSSLPRRRAYLFHFGRRKAPPIFLEFHIKAQRRIGQTNSPYVRPFSSTHSTTYGHYERVRSVLLAERSLLPSPAPY